jgi:ankyrin repeat protein
MSKTIRYVLFLLMLLIHRVQLLAGANINDVTANRRSALHIAAENSRGVLCSILLENHIHANLLDSNQNTGYIRER